MASTPQAGDRVAVRYTGKLKDGTVFDSNVGAEPLWFTMTGPDGPSEVIPGFEEAVRGLAIGQRRTVEVPPADAYGDRDEELVIAVEAKIFGEAKPTQGLEVALRGQDGAVFNGKIARVEGSTVHVDLNHPLAGKVLVFDVELVKIGA